jgi:HlyD family secretion protein
MIRDTSATDRPIERRWGLSRNHLLLALGAVALLGGGALIFPSASQWLQAERSVDFTRLRVGTVTRGDLLRDLSVQGRIVAAFHPTLYSPERGVVRLLVLAGDEISLGQELARVDSPELKSRLKQEESSLMSAQADLERQRILAKQQQLKSQQEVDLFAVKVEAAERAMGRAAESRSAGILNDVEFEAAQDELAVTSLNLEHARQTAALEGEDLEFEIRNRERQVDRQGLVVEEIRRQVDQLAIRSPVDGLVSRLDIKDRDAVTVGQPLLAVVDLSAFEVEIAVPENYADEIGAGTESLITYDSREFAGQVKSISPEVEGSQVKGVVVFTGGIPQGLKQNQRVSTRLVMESRPDVLKVARGPFLENGGGRQAYMVDGDMAVLQAIQVGTVSVSEVEIVAGLEEGDRIIISDMTRYQGAQKLLLRR